MSLETDFYSTVAAICPRVFPDFAPVDTARPFVTWSQIGGRALTPLGKDVPDRREAIMQVNVWSDTRLEANQTILAIDAALRISVVFDARPNGEFMAITHEETDLRGAIQDFVIRGWR